VPWYVWMKQNRHSRNGSALDTPHRLVVPLLVVTLSSPGLSGMESLVPADQTPDRLSPEEKKGPRWPATTHATTSSAKS
jgi:hypothetical protein